MRISTGVDSRPNGGTVNHSTESTGPPQATRSPLGGRERITQGSRAPARAEGPIFWTAEPWKPAARRRAAIDFTERVFGYRAESPGCQTDFLGGLQPIRFGYRAESPGCQTWVGSRLFRLPFGYRAESPGCQTRAGGTAGRMLDRALETDEKTQVFLLQRPRTGSFPVRCGSPQASIPVPTTVQ